MTIVLDDIVLNVFGSRLVVEETSSDTNTTTVGGLTRTEIGFKKWRITVTLDGLTSDILDYIKSVANDIHVIANTYKGLIETDMRIDKASVPQIVGFENGNPVFCGWTITLEERGSHA